MRKTVAAHGYAEGAEECTLCVMSWPDVEHLLKTKPALAVRVIEIMARRRREAEARLESVVLKKSGSSHAALSRSVAR